MSKFCRFVSDNTPNSEPNVLTLCQRDDGDIEMKISVRDKGESGVSFRTSGSRLYNYGKIIPLFSQIIDFINNDKTCEEKSLICAVHDNTLKEPSLSKKESTYFFPFKVGDKVYEPTNRGVISTYKITSIEIHESNIFVDWTIIDGFYSNLSGFELSRLGKDVFLSKREAKEAMVKKDGA